MEKHSLRNDILKLEKKIGERQVELRRCYNALTGGEIIRPQISTDDFINQPCYVLNQMKKTYTHLFVSKIGGIFSNYGESKIVEQFLRTMPIMRKVNRTRFTHSNLTVDIGETIGRGSFGSVFKSHFSIGTYRKEIVVKVLSSNVDEYDFLRESIVHMELFCGMRGQWGTGARIPKIDLMR